MVDITVIFVHWYAGRPKVEVARSLGVDVKTVRKYVAAAEAAGLAPGGPPVSEQEWRALAREWFPELAGISSRRTSWAEIACHHDRIGELLGVVPASVIWQRLRDEEGLSASVASVRRYVRAQFPEHARRVRSRSGGRRCRLAPRPRLITGTWARGSIRGRGAGGGCGRSRWCCAIRGTCSSGR